MINQFYNYTQINSVMNLLHTYIGWSCSLGTIVHQWNIELFVLMNHYILQSLLQPTTVFFQQRLLSMFLFTLQAHGVSWFYFIVLFRSWLRLYIVHKSKRWHFLFCYIHRIIGSNFQHFISVIRWNAALNSRQTSQFTVHGDGELDYCCMHFNISPFVHLYSSDLFAVFDERIHNSKQNESFT